MTDLPLRASRAAALLLALVVAACGTPDAPPAEADEDASAPDTEAPHEVLGLWAMGQPAFGVYAPDERPREPGQRGGPREPAVYTEEGARRLAENPLYDFVFLNLEGAYDVEAVRVMARGLGRADGSGSTTLLVRIPSIADAGEEATRERVREILALGADGVVLPHVRSLEEARTATGFFADAGADVWSPQNPGGDVVAMLMVEDPDAVAQAAEIADLPGYGVLACGIGSLTQAMGGDREGAEAGCRDVLAQATRAGKADMMIANAETITGRVEEGYLALLTQGPTADDVIRTGRAAAGR